MNKPMGSRALARAFAGALAVWCADGFAVAPAWADSQIANLAGIEKLDYDVLRNGDKIGDHSFRFSRNGNVLDVEIDTDVRVKLAFVTLYRFWHHSTEKWIDGRLVELTSKTDDDGTSHEMDARSSTGAIAVVADKKARRVEPGVIPASLWDARILQVPATLNTIDGTTMAISTAFVDESEEKGPEGMVRARHHAITGELQRELWFDARGALVKVRFKGQDGSDIQYVLK